MPACADQTAIVVGDAAVAVIRVVQEGPAPAAVALLARRLQRVAVHADVGAAALVGAARRVVVATIATAIAPVAPAAFELAVIVDDAGIAIVGVLQIGVVPGAVAALAARGEQVA